jgi:hypothetical protein
MRTGVALPNTMQQPMLAQAIMHEENSVYQTEIDSAELTSER